MAAEFAIILPMLLLLIFGTLQYSLLFFTYNSMLHAANDATRLLSRGILTKEQAEARALAVLPNWVNDGDWTITSTDAVAGSDVNTVISVAASEASILAFAPMPATLNARVVMRKEG